MSKQFITNVESSKFDYRRPNEGQPENIKPFLTLNAPGVIVSTGTERSIGFLPFLSEEANKENPTCVKGVISCDINPLVKMYNDYLILMLRLCEDQKEFCQWSLTPVWVKNINPNLSVINSLSKEECKAHIRVKLAENRELSHKMKEYYTKNFEALSDAYYDAMNLPGNSQCALLEVNYLSPDNQRHFSCLQRFAKEGKLVSVVGNINDLRWLENINIGVIDASNIDLSEKINPHFASSQKKLPRLIWTQQSFFCTLFFSKKFRGNETIPAPLPREYNNYRLISANNQTLNLSQTEQEEDNVNEIMVSGDIKVHEIFSGRIR